MAFVAETGTFGNEQSITDPRLIGNPHIFRVGRMSIKNMRLAQNEQDEAGTGTQ
jgi:hypothetical protein